MSAPIVQTDEKDLTKFAFSIQQLAAGRSNAVGEVTLAVTTTTTTVSFINCGADSVVILAPKTANAAAELANGTAYVGTVGAGSFTITHASSSESDRTFGFVCVG